MRKTCIAIILMILLILSFSNKKTEKYDTRAKMLYSYKIISAKIKNNGKVNTIDEYKVINSNKEIFRSDKIVGTGKFVRLKSNIVYGFLNYNGYCLKKEYNDKLNFAKGTCKDILLPEIAYNKIETNNRSSLKDDIYSLKKNDFDSRKYFIGLNPNNYIIYSGSCWRIVNIAHNNNLKIVYEGKSLNNSCEDVSTNVTGSIGLFTWDTDKAKVGNWETQSYLRERMDYWAEKKVIDVTQLAIKIDDKYIDDSYWNIGSINGNNKTVEEDIENEQKSITKDKHKFGLLNSSDYLKINCKTSSGLSTVECSKNNYLYKSKYNWWTINNVNNGEKNVWVIMQDGTVANKSVKLSNEYFFSGTRIAAYLKSDIYLIGNGTDKTPYIIVK